MGPVASGPGWNLTSACNCLWGARISLYLLGEVVPVDVVTVGVSSWTLNVDPMALQDCGFLEEEDGLLDLWQIITDFLPLLNSFSSSRCCDQREQRRKREAFPAQREEK